MPSKEMTNAPKVGMRRLRGNNSSAPPSPAGGPTNAYTKQVQTDGDFVHDMTNSMNDMKLDRIPKLRVQKPGHARRVSVNTQGSVSAPVSMYEADDMDDLPEFF